DFCSDGGVRLFRGSRVAEFLQASEATRDRAPMFAVMTADTANGADRDAVLCPGARREGKAQHGSQDVRVARFAPQNPTDLGIDIGGYERGDGRVMTSQAECKIPLELLLAG